MDNIIQLIQLSPILQNLIANPPMAIAVVAVAFVLSKLLKLTGKVIKLILVCGAAYIIVNFLMSGVV